jgi:hypothetical protein
MRIEEEERKKWEEVLAAQREIAGKEERKRAREREEGRGKERQTQKVAGREDAAEDQTGDGKEE